MPNTTGKRRRRGRRGKRKQLLEEKKAEQLDENEDLQANASHLKDELQGEPSQQIDQDLDPQMNALRSHKEVEQKNSDQSRATEGTTIEDIDQESGSNLSAASTQESTSNKKQKPKYRSKWGNFEAIDIGFDLRDEICVVLESVELDHEKIDVVSRIIICEWLCDLEHADAERVLERIHRKYFRNVGFVLRALISVGQLLVLSPEYTRVLGKIPFWSEQTILHIDVPVKFVFYRPIKRGKKRSGNDLGRASKLCRMQLRRVKQNLSDGNIEGLAKLQTKDSQKTLSELSLIQRQCKSALNALEKSETVLSDLQSQEPVGKQHGKQIKAMLMSVGNKKRKVDRTLTNINKEKDEALLELGMQSTSINQPENAADRVDLNHVEHVLSEWTRMDRREFGQSTTWYLFLRMGDYIPRVFYSKYWSAREAVVKQDAVRQLVISTTRDNTANLGLSKTDRILLARMGERLQSELRGDSILKYGI